MKKITGIYKITNNQNQKIYIGLSKNCLRRWYDHRSKAFNSNRIDDLEKPLYRAFRKYGLENFSFEIIEECKIEDLAEREIHFIKLYDSYNRGYNANLGGDLGPNIENCLRGEKHPGAKLTEKDVVFCRSKYREGARAREVWERYYSETINFRGFQKMWHGETWKQIEPESFQIKTPHPKKRTDPLLIEEVLSIYKKEKSYRGTARHFKGRLGYGTIYNICSTNGERTYSPRK